MNELEIYYLLALQKVKNIGDITAKKLLRQYGSAKNIFDAIAQKSFDVKNTSKLIIQSLEDFSDWERVDSEMQFISDQQLNIMTIFDDDYPHKLFHAPDSPILFFWKGNIDWRMPRAISMVGTRNMTHYGKRMVAEIIEGLKEYNPIIISGLAYGVDVESHINAMKNNLSTIGVLGHGFNRIYPSIHKKIADNMLENGGLISEFWHSDIVDRNNFLKRNRIVAGLSEATIIIESGEKGGSLVTADIANSYNRDVFAVPGRANDTFSQGCNNLIKQNKAALVTSAQDIIQYLQWENKKNEKKNLQLNLFVELSEDEQQIFDLLQEKGKMSLDEMAVMLRFPVSKTAQLLLQMELNNVVKGLSGKFFELY
jgi:DNA processing protein